MRPHSTPVLRALACLAVLAAGSVRAETTPLSSPGDFSGAQTLVSFDDLGAASPSDLPAAGGVGLLLSNGRPARFMLVNAPREFGPPGSGSINNFAGQPFPFPDLRLLLPAPMTRVGFEMRVNSLDSVTVSLLSGGALIDQVSVPSRGVSAFYFYGYENPAGFDEVLVAVGPVTGSLSLDNLAFEAAEPPAPEPTVLACEGFESLAERMVRHRGREFREQRRWYHRWIALERLFHVRLLHARLLDADGTAVGGDGVASPPLVRVQAVEKDGALVDVTDRVLRGASPEFRHSEWGDWWFALPHRWLHGRGAWVVTLESGDEAEYQIDPTCTLELGRRWHRRGAHGDDD